MSAPKLTDLPLWQSFEERALRVLRYALDLLPSSHPDLDELILNRLLYASIAEANRLINIQDGGGFASMPSRDGYQAPQDVAEPPEEFERKRPDFIWSLHDHTAPTGLEGCREFVVECKRLGDAQEGPDFNNRYVDRGIIRFISATHKYGVMGASGVMVGYVQRSNNLVILAVVQQRSEVRHRLGRIEAANGVDMPIVDMPIVELRQMLERDFGNSPFKLFHLWVDLRQPIGAAG